MEAYLIVVQIFWLGIIALGVSMWSMRGVARDPLPFDCDTGKVGYSNEQDAEDAAKLFTHRYYADTFSSYVCPRCYQYHLTTQPQERLHLI